MSSNTCICKLSSARMFALETGETSGAIGGTYC